MITVTPHKYSKTSPLLRVSAKESGSSANSHRRASSVEPEEQVDSVTVPLATKREC